MKNLFMIALLLSVVYSSSCTKILDPDYDEAEAKVVIQAELVADSFCVVKITKTQNYYDSSAVPKVSTAFVVLEDNMGNRDTLDYVSDGIYKNDDMIGVVGRVYTLTVRVDGEEYTSVQPMYQVTEIDSLEYEYVSGSPFEEEGYYPTAYAKEPQNEVNYYMWKFYRNDSLLGASDGDIWISDDRFVGEDIDGIKFPYVYKLNDKATVEFYSLTKDAYIFYNDILTQQYSDGGFFSTPPANPRATFTNGAIGAFRVSDIRKMSIDIL